MMKKIFSLVLMAGFSLLVILPTISNSEDDPDPWTKTLDLMQKFQYREALKLLQNQLTQRPEDMYVKIKMIECYEKLEEYGEAIKLHESFLDEYLSASSGGNYELYKIGNLYLWLKPPNIEKSIEAFQRYIKWYTEKGEENLDENLYYESKKMVSFMENNSDYNRQPLRTYMAAIKLEYEDAIKELQRLIDTYADSSLADDAQYEIGRIYCRPDYQTREESTPEWKMSNSERGSNYKNAIAAYRKLIKIYPNSEWVDDAMYAIPWVEYIWVRWKASKEEFKDIISMFEKVVRFYPDSEKAAKAQYQIGYIYNSKIGDYKKAIESFRKFIDNYPNFFDPSYFDNSASSRGYFQSIIADCYRKLGDSEKAIIEFRKAIKINPDSREANIAFLAIGEIYIELKEWEKAEKVYNEYCQKNSKNIYSLDYKLAKERLSILKDNYDFDGRPLSEYFAAEKNYQQHYSGDVHNIHRIEEVVDRYPSSKIADDILIKVANLYHHAEDYPLELSAYQRLLRQYPKSPLITEKVYFKIGECYEKMGKWIEAIFMYSKVTDKESKIYKKTKDQIEKCLKRKLWIKYTVGDGLIRNGVFTFVPDKIDSDIAWVSFSGFEYTSSGICKYDRKTNTFIKDLRISLTGFGKFIIDTTHPDFVWFFSYNGGVHLYSRYNDTWTSLNNKFAFWNPKLVVNDNNYLWVVTSRGLNRYDKIKEEKKLFSETEGIEILSLAPDSNYLWVGTSKGIMQLNKKEGKWETLNEIDGFKISQVKLIKVDNEHVWFAASNGLISYKKSTGKWVNYLNMEGLYRINSILVDEDKVWIGSGRGLFLYSKSDGSLKRCLLADGSPVLSNSITVDKDYIWVVDSLGKIYRYDKKELKWEVFLETTDWLMGTYWDYPAQILAEENNIWCYGPYTYLTRYKKDKNAHQSYSLDSIGIIKNDVFLKKYASSGGETSILLKEGMGVEILSEKNNWVEIQVPFSHKGWIDSNKIYRYENINEINKIAKQRESE
ncbi:MAG: tetratricopeptide repeat protein [bacterium]